MLVVETIAKIRRAFFIEGKSIKQICCDLRLSRNTVRKVVRSGDTAFNYDRSVQPRPKIDPWKDQLVSLLETNASKPKRERLTLVRVYEELRNLGYDGSYDAVRRYAATWSRETQEASASAYVPLSFDPGEAYQFDWSHEVVLIDGVTTTVKVAHVRLSHSRMPYVRAYPRETQEMVFDAHDNAPLERSLILTTPPVAEASTDLSVRNAPVLFGWAEQGRAQHDLRPDGDPTQGAGAVKSGGTLASRGRNRISTRRLARHATPEPLFGAPTGWQADQSMETCQPG